MKQDKITNILISALIILALIIIFIQVQQSGIVDIKINSAMNQIKISDGLDGKNGYTPIKNIDYFDGKDGKDSKSTHTKEIVTEKTIKEVPIIGEKGDKGDNAYFDIRCNEEKNRWEVKYLINETWQILNGVAIKCTI